MRRPDPLIVMISMLCGCTIGIPYTHHSMQLRSVARYGAGENCSTDFFRQIWMKVGLQIHACVFITSVSICYKCNINTSIRYGCMLSLHRGKEQAQCDYISFINKKRKNVIDIDLQINLNARIVYMNKRRSWNWFLLLNYQGFQPQSWQDLQKPCLQMVWGGERRITQEVFSTVWGTVNG